MQSVKILATFLGVIICYGALMGAIGYIAGYVAA